MPSATSSQETSFSLMDWPLQSPVLSAVENLWDVLEKTLLQYSSPVINTGYWREMNATLDRNKCTIWHMCSVIRAKDTPGNIRMHNFVGDAVYILNIAKTHDQHAAYTTLLV